MRWSIAALFTAGMSVLLGAQGKPPGQPSVSPYKLGMFQRANAEFIGIVVGDRVIDLAAASAPGPAASWTTLSPGELVDHILATHHRYLWDELPRLTALIAFLKCGCHCSFSTIRKFLRDVVGLTISRGQLAKLCGRVSDSLALRYQQLLELLPTQERVNVDETGHKDNGDAFWTWCFRAPLFTLFKISPSRGSDVLFAVLGKEFDGVLG